MDLADLISRELGDDWIPNIYRQKIRSGRTRSIHLQISKREWEPVIHHTLLGIELKVGRKRIACPDLATAKYLQTFARFGCSSVAVPYDISLIPKIADELESAWDRTFRLAGELSDDPTGRDRRDLVKAIRSEINEIGPGEAMPLFDTETRQRGG
jgi:hypothetical protein